jgi:glycosyltransferase involved in cell wall biosynthesis
MDNSSMLAAWTGRPARTSPAKAALPATEVKVAVIIPTFNHAHFLADAIRSVLAQTRQADEIIVVDDGSTDDPATVVAQFQAVRLIRQENRGLSGARNTGLWNCKSSYVVFLDADDRLLPTALQAGLACIFSHPECAFVYGGHRRIAEDGNAFGTHFMIPLQGDPYLGLLRGNLVGAIMTVLFRRDCLLALNGFDETLRRCEDHDLYLRVAQRYPIASHHTIIAEYRKHGQAMSNDYVEMLEVELELLDRRETPDPLVRAAIRDGRAQIRSFYVSRMLDAAVVRWRARHDTRILVRDLIQAARWSPLLAVRTLLGGLGRRVKRMLRSRV